MKKVLSILLALSILASVVCVPVSAAETWLWPTGSAYGYGKITSSYGYRTYNNRNHNGIDIGAPNGAKIYASRSGTVISSGYSSSAGNNVIIDHGDGYTTTYMHMSSRAVEKGVKVSRGQVIGYVGNTGASDGAHLHFEIKYNGSYVNPNPADYGIKGSVVNGQRGSITYSFDTSASTPSPSPSQSLAISNPNQLIQNGQSGTAVKELQASLNKIMNAGLDVDGKFGAKTLAAVKAFQSKYGLAVDGIAGPNTNVKINQLLQHQHSYRNGYEAAHPHREYKTCSCGDIQYTGGTRTLDSCTTCNPPHEHSYITETEDEHPHKIYKVCQTCDSMEYTGQTEKLVNCEECYPHEHSYKTKTEAAHPHEKYKICDCGDIQYTGSTVKDEDCEKCFPEKFEEAEGTKRVLKLQIGVPQMFVDGMSAEIDPGRGTVPIMRNDRTLIPIRAVVEAFGAYVIWDETESKVTVISDDTTMQLWIDKNFAFANEKLYEMDVAPFTLNDRTYMPLRFIAEKLGLTVGWNEANQTVTIEGTL